MKPQRHAADSKSLPPRRRLRVLMSDHHRRMEQMCKELLACAYADDSRDLIAQWSELERELLAHIAAEEEIILPGYAHHDPADAQRIRADHEQLRQLATPIGVEIELHEARAERLRLLVAALQHHATNEDSKMYPWAAHNLPTVAQQLLVTRVSHWLNKAS